MRSVIFRTGIFRTARDIKRGELALSLYLNTLFSIDKQYLRDYPQTPGLYQTGVYYKREPKRGLVRVGDEELPGVETWKTVPKIIEDGFGDCEDLACWRAAELYVRSGIDAQPIWTVQTRPKARYYHIRVRYPDGRIEDPSKILGM